MQARLTKWIACGLLLLTAGAAHAQDANYWSTAYGTRAQLLGGVVIGSPGDISSTYYNPGLFALTQNSELLLAGTAYQYQKVAVDGGAGPGRKLVSSSIFTVPSLFAGEIPLLKHDKLAYVFLTRRSMDMQIDSRSTKGVDAVVPISNPVFAAAEVNLHQDFSETWYGLTWAHQLSPTLGIGVSPFLSVRSQTTRAAVLSEGQDSTGDMAVLSQSRQFSFIHYSLLARIGIGGVRDSLTYGVTVTTPNLSVMGGGGTAYNSTLVDQTGTIGNVFGADYRQDLEVKHKTPLGAGGGASFGWGASRLHAAVDWYAEVARYTVIESPDFVVHKPSGDSTVSVVITDQMNSVLNWGVGLEHRFGDTISGFASYHTDLTGREQGSAPGASITSWDLQDVAVGVTWKVWRSDFAFGVTTAFGSQPTAPPANPAEGAPALKDLQTHEQLVTVNLGWKVSF